MLGVRRLLGGGYTLWGGAPALTRGLSGLSCLVRWVREGAPGL